MSKEISQILELFPFSSGVSTDSRSVAAGNIFFALRGESFDGNNYARQALEKGALISVVERDSEFGQRVAAARLNPDYGTKTDRDRLKRYILVESPLRAFQLLAKWHRQGFRIPVLGLTGTNCKTTTKELINAVLSKRFRVVATEGNLNNSIGVPMTLFKISMSTQIAVVEMGASHPGDIEELVNVAVPNFGLITNVGKAHLQGFGSFEGVKKTKGELYDYLQEHSGTVFLNVDNPDLFKMVDDRPGINPITYGVKHQEVEVLPVTAHDPYLRIKIGGAVVNTHLVGSYNVDNVLAAIAIGEHFGVPTEECYAAVAEYVPTNNRSELKKGKHNLLVVDAYNANPTSMKVSLDNFDKTEFKNKGVILGDMRELGDYSEQEHKEILDLLAAMDLKKVILVGAEFGALQEYAEGIDSKVKPLFFADVEALKVYLHKEHLKNHTILVKGSNGIRLQSIIPEL
ncbi:MAG: UDP-N-acetylmuramoyl-tripeptide--D-alanyl-D-alanine ligase [Bacteroidales bacterium]|nr:UDP-N-acetylmuramoyl-tripeptide--D-alanyl-D-alanine ligase [Bacteroidales bacterium]